MSNRRNLVAYVAPMAVFVGFLALSSLLKRVDDAFWLRAPEYWIYPLQTLICAGLVAYFWQEYRLKPLRGVGIGLAIGILVFVIWISPQAFLGFPARTTGFDPDLFAGQTGLYWGTLVLRLLRIAVVVPFVEEIFWRGFLLRYLIDEEFERVPFGTFSALSFWAVALAFGFSHSSPDWPAAIVTGLLYNGVAYWTKSLSTCVLTHAVTNLLLGIWILETKQWGFW
jgi:CAAX protease family protein